MAHLIKPILFAAPLLLPAACAVPAPQATSKPPVETHVAGPSTTDQGTPRYARLIPFENNMGVVQSANSLPPGAE